ncbi:DUF2680 domain-containing protein [Sedimentibacter sp. B4]|uniref:DUF2680 domain-containing protein n=1 Tax=Sedimentibacter sp. B4 TaxID=304766 RepID=UPI00030AD91B|nr:DUF2680 domain-containing protein [Sedimentibacter sp. B4]
MTNLKKLAVLGAVVMAIGTTTVTAFAAANFATPAELAAAVTGNTVEEVTEEKLQSGKTYGEIAKDYDSLEEFQSAMLENKIAILQERVEAGTMTQEEADAIIKAIEENQAVCDGTGQARVGQQFGAGFGGMMGNGNAQGRGLGNGLGRGQGGNMAGNGFGLRNGSCLVQE